MHLHHRPMHVYLQTERLILRRFTLDDVDLATELDSDPEVMRYITGGLPTPRDEIRDDYLPSWLAYYERGDAYGFWAAIEKRRRPACAGSASSTRSGRTGSRARSSATSSTR
jgi:RimJ/RimL family protein N-acetyltransferase